MVPQKIIKDPCLPGGRQSKTIEEKKIKNRQFNDEQINWFPRVESHYCRASRSRDYLHPDLSLPKMYDMYRREYKYQLNDELPSLSTYRRVFSTKNVSFHWPKKDQCSLCMAFREIHQLKKTSENSIILTLKKKKK